MPHDSAAPPIDAASAPRRGLGAIAFGLAARRITRPWTAGALVYGIVYELVRRLPGEASARSFFTNVGLLPISALVVALALTLRVRGLGGERDRGAWTFLTAAFISLFVGDVGRWIVEDLPGLGASTAWVHYANAAYSPLLLGGLLWLVGGIKRGTYRLRVGLDVLTVMTSAVVLSAHYVVQPRVAAGQMSFAALLYPIGDLAAFLGMSMVVLRRPPHVAHAVVRWLAVAVFVAFLGNGLRSYLEMRGVTELFGLDDTLRLAISCAFLAAIETRATGGFRTGADRRDDGEAQLSLHALPYVATGIAYLVLIAECWANRRLAPWDLAVGAAAVTIAVVARQVLAVRENALLWKERAGLLGEARLSALVRHATDAVWILDAQGFVRWASPSSLAVAGREPGELVGQGFLGAFSGTETDRVRELFEQALAAPRNPVRAEAPVAMPAIADGAFVELTLTNLLSEPHVGGVVANLHDVTSRTTLEKQLSRQAFQDGLTGLSNRLLFQNRVEHALARCLRAGTRMACCLVDLDHFKMVNDGLGHTTGDALLVEVARRLRSQMREVDTIARLGGDEFAILVEDLPDDGAAALLAGRIDAAFREPFLVEGSEVRITSSVGIALAAPADTCETLLRNADTAMYVAKSRGRNMAISFEDSMHHQARENLELQGDLRTAIECGDLRVHYQPIVDLESGAIVGLEALARWTHAQRGVISPERFIPLAESTGLIVALGREILSRALREMKAADGRWPLGKAPILFVNISVRQLQDDGFVEWVRAELDRNAYDPRRLCIELTESVFAHRTDGIQAPLERLRDLGMWIGIDDFGTGYSSLSYLHRFPLDVLKIPREFVERLGGAEDGAILAHSIVALATAMNLHTIGEGIETEAQHRALKDLGCEWGQGFGIARPAPMDDVLARLLGAGASRIELPAAAE